MLILDFGSGETCKNDIEYVYRMIDEIPPTDKEVLIKWQLFEKVGDLTPLDHDVYLDAVTYAEGRGYATGASVFDLESLEFLLSNDPAFVKIACRQHLYPLIEKVPEDVPLVVSVPSRSLFNEVQRRYIRAKVLCCVSEYPAAPDEYEMRFTKKQLKQGISDHTETLRLYYTYRPEVIEMHYCLTDSTGPDAAGFAIKPSGLGNVL